MVRAARLPARSLGRPGQDTVEHLVSKRGLTRGKQLPFLEAHMGRQQSGEVAERFAVAVARRFELVAQLSVLAPNSVALRPKTGSGERGQQHLLLDLEMRPQLRLEAPPHPFDQLPIGGALSEPSA